MIKIYYLYSIFAIFVPVILIDMSFETLSLLLLCYLLTGILLRAYSIKKHFGKYLVLGIYYVSLILIPSFHLVYNSKRETTDVDYERLMTMGVEVYLVTILIFFIVAHLVKGNVNKSVQYNPRVIKKSTFRNVFILLMLLTAFCYSIGLGRMGYEAVSLPFHLGGIINIFRMNLVPPLFAIGIDNLIVRGEKIPKKYFWGYGIWTLFEIIAWMSKGILLSYTLSVLIVLYLHYRPPFKTVMIRLAPLILAFLILYPVIGILRKVDLSSGSMTSNYKNAKSETEEKVVDNNKAAFVLSPLNRQFLTSTLYIRDYEFIPDKTLFDFSNSPAIILSGGTAKYQTFVIDAYPEWAVHSSGTTGIIDPLLFGGFGLCYLMTLITMLLAGIIEKYYRQGKYCSFIFLASFVAALCIGENISLFLNGVGIQQIASVILVVMLANKINYRKKTVDINKILVGC